MTDLSAIHDFLCCPTPAAWVDCALDSQDILLIDHANCEKKAAASAMNLMYRYVDKGELLKKMSQLAREELLHFEQVVQLMEQRQIAYRHLSPSRYAAALHLRRRSRIAKNPASARFTRSNSMPISDSVESIAPALRVFA